MTAKDYFLRNWSKVESSTLPGPAVESAITVIFNLIKFRLDIYFSLDFSRQLHLTFASHQPRDTQYSTYLQIHQIPVQLPKAHLPKTRLQLLVQINICQGPLLLNDLHNREGHWPRAPDIVQAYISPGRPGSLTNLGNRDRSSFLLETLPETLIPVLHIGSNRRLDPLQRIPEILPRNILGFNIATKRHKTSLANNRLEISTRIASRLGRHMVKIDILGQRHVCTVDFEHLHPCRMIGRWHEDQPIEPARTQNSRISNIRPVSRADYYHVFQRFYSIKFGEELAYYSL